MSANVITLHISYVNVSHLNLQDNGVRWNCTWRHVFSSLPNFYFYCDINATVKPTIMSAKLKIQYSYLLILKQVFLEIKYNFFFSYTFRKMHVIVKEIGEKKWLILYDFFPSPVNVLLSLPRKKSLKIPKG